ncbi:hypothetical protein [Methanoculleus sp.]|uniref:hypothetical protein n=1 Tax=Methanoculleus sp. TaxID=90427 RepID=UPI0025CC987D|nr:hypothetical protein [Methanoculleus sp.]
MKQTQKKSSKDENTPWMKWAYVGVALLVAVAMVGTYLAPMFEKKQTADIGSMALIGYTIRAEDGRPLVTTDQNLLTSEYEKGNLVLLTSGIEIPVGAQISGENVAPVPILYPEITGFNGFGLLGFEANAISAGLVGMQTGETRAVTFSYGANDLEVNLSREDADGIGLNFTETEVGDQVPLGFTASPDVPVGNETNQTPALRFGKVTDKTSDTLVIMYRYGSAEVTLNSITG